MNAVTLLFLGKAEGAVAAAKETDAAIAGVGKTSEETAARTDKAGAAAGGLHGKLGDLAKSALLTGGAFLAAGGLVAGIKGAIDATEQDQVAQAKLEAAFKASGVAIDPYRAKIEETVKSSAELGFKSGDVKDAIGSLVTATGDGTKAINLLSTAQNIARFRHIGLNDAAKTLTMTMAGSTRAAHMLGIQTITVTTAQDAVRAKYSASVQALENAAGSTSKMTAAQKQQYDAQKALLKAKEQDELKTAALTDKNHQAAQVVDLVNQKLHGQAQAYADTAAGARDKLGAQLELLEVQLGGPVLNALALVAGALASVVGWIMKNENVLGPLAIVVGVAAAAWGGYLLVTQGIPAAAAAASAGIEGMGAALAANPIGVVIVLVALLVTGIIELWKHSETFRDIVKGVWADIRGSTEAFVSFFTSTVPHAFEVVRDKIIGGLTAAKDWVRSHWPEIATIISGPFAPVVALATNAFGIRSRLVGAFHSLENDAQSIWSDIVGVVKGAAGRFAFAISPITSTVSRIVGWLKQLYEWAMKAIGALSKVHVPGSGVLHAVGGAIGSVIPHAAGGIFTTPHVGLVAEAGPEAIIPLSGGRGRQMLEAAGIGGGGPTYNYTFHVTSLATTSRGLAQELARIVDGGPSTPSITVVAR